jgi:hypothetical protein
MTETHFALSRYEEACCELIYQMQGAKSAANESVPFVVVLKLVFARETVL